jgi:2-dehydropantoate 2-reductase
VNDTWYILGAGAIGSLFACKLQQAGIASCLLTRDGGQHAMTLITDDGTESLRVPRCTLAELPDKSVGKLMITTKAQQALPAWMQAQACLADNAVVVLMHNGMGVAEQILARHPAAAPYLGSTTEAAYFTVSGELVHAGQGDTRIGAAGKPSAPTWFAELATSALRFSWEADIEASLWRKLIINCAINPLSAVHSCRNGLLASDPLLREQATILCDELGAITAARGYSELAANVGSMAFEVMTATANNQSSMMLDVKAGRASEIEYITGYLVNEALRLGVPCPANRQLLEQVRALDKAHARENL